MLFKQAYVDNNTFQATLITGNIITIILTESTFIDDTRNHTHSLNVYDRWLEL